MNFTKKIICILTISVYGLTVSGKNIEASKKLFKLINLELPGLEKTKLFVEQEDYANAKIEFLKYYRSRNDIKHPEINLSDKQDWIGRSLSTKEKEMAVKGMKHEFYVQKGYGYFDYGKEINWQYWPIKDNEIRWQLHRMYWWIPMGKMYWSTQNENYTKEWIFQFRDWIKDNPRGLSKENDRFAWRALETSRRIQDQTTLFNLFLHSKYFTSDFLVEFLLNYHEHSEWVSSNYSKEGNHLLFQAQRILYAGGFFQEFKNAKRWRDEGIDILTNQIMEQIHEDGYQYELSPNYHRASIHIFLQGLEMAKLCGLENEFPVAYKEKIKSMIHASIKVSFPDMVYPMFGDAQLTTRETMIKNYKKWYEFFPNDKVLQYYATGGKEGNIPNYLSVPLSNSGFYTFRNGWDSESTTLIMRAGIPGGPFHSQPDNGTFELWHKGVNLMPDTGCYVYSGDKKITAARNWYRQSAVHQTLTLNDKDIKIDGKQLKWNTSESSSYVVYENPSYNDLKHRRSVFFVDNTFFVIVDEALGKATGEIKVRYQLKEGKASYDFSKNSFWSNNANEPNVQINVFSNSKVETKKEELKISYKYRKEQPRKGVAFSVQKKNEKPVRFISVVYPFDDKPSSKFKVKARFTKVSNNMTEIKVKLNGKRYLLGYDLSTQN